MRVGDAGEAADHDVLGVASDGGRRAHVGGHRDRQQVGLRVAAHAQGQFQHQRGEHQTDRVIDQESGEQARDSGDRAQQDEWRAGVPHHPGRGHGEGAGQPQPSDDDHDAEQQRDGVEVDRADRVLEG